MNTPTPQAQSETPRTTDALEGAIGIHDALNRVTALCDTLERELSDAHRWASFNLNEP